MAEKRRVTWAAAVIGLKLMWAAAACGGQVDRPALASADSIDRTVAWQAIIASSRAYSDLQRAIGINRFFNQFRSVPDSELWGVADYWATPEQVLAVGAGDCEDFALAKYVSLIRTGVAADRLWLAYTRALQPDKRRIESHMVLVFHSNDGRYWVLDNLRADVVPLAQRRDLSVSTALNGSGVWHLSKTDAPVLVAGREAVPPQARRLLEADERGAALARADGMSMTQDRSAVR
jgi:predicted transglutaminase-like cysteine proteinase